MKKLPSILLYSVISATALYGGAGIFDSFGIVNSTYYNLNAATVNVDFQGANLGDFTTSDSISLGGQLKSYKNNGTDVTSALISYVIYEDGSRPSSPVFTDVAYVFQIDSVGGTFGDQQWGTDIAGGNSSDVSTTISLSAFSAGNYKLEVFAKITTNGVDAGTEIFDNFSGSNYIADFTVVPEPSSFALMGGLFVCILAGLKRHSRT